MSQAREPRHATTPACAALRVPARVHLHYAWRARGTRRAQVSARALRAWRAEVAWLAALLTMPLHACGDASPAANAGDAGLDAAATHEPTTHQDASATELYEFPCLEPWQPTGESRYDAVFHELFCTHGCTAPYCHGSRTASAGLSFENLAVGYAGLTAPEPDPQSMCGPSRRRLVPGEPAHSLLYLKLAGEAGCGSAMPPLDSGWPPLDAAELAQLADWIRAGAPND